MQLLKTILLSQFTLILVVLVHELGHFFAMRAFSIKVDTFSIGFGKGWTLFKWKETEFMITPIILGGYVSPETDSYENAKAYEKLVVSLAGPLAGLIGAIIPFFIISYFYDGNSFWFSLANACIIPFYLVGKVSIAIGGFFANFFPHAKEIISHVTINSAGRASANYTFMEDSDSKMFLIKIAILSVVLSILNMVPIPPFDGGHVVTHLYEIVFRRRANKQVVLWTSLVVVVALILLFFLGIFNDIKTLF